LPPPKKRKTNKCKKKSTKKGQSKVKESEFLRSGVNGQRALKKKPQNKW
jgi:hypothetical protein